MFNTESIIFVVYLIFMLGIGVFFFFRDKQHMGERVSP